MFRVAEFKKVKGKQVFTGFAYRGYKLDPAGKLSHYKKKISQTDRRRKNYVELNMAVQQKDINGNEVFAEDYVFERINQINGIVKYSPNFGGFIIRVDAGKIEVPYTYLKVDELEVEVWGNRYQDKGRKNKWKR